MRKTIQFAIAALSLAVLCASYSPSALAQMQVSGGRAVSSITNAAGSLFLTIFDLTNSDPAAVAIVDGTGTQITSFGGGTQFAEDAALGAAPVGTLSMARRDDALSALTPAEGDAVGLRVDANGALWVIPSGTTAISGNVGQTGTWNVGLSAGTNMIGKVAPHTGCGSTIFDHALQAAPTSATNITTTTTCVLTITVANTNATAQTILVQDNQGSPITLVPTISVPGNSTVTWDFNGVKLTSGIKVTAGGTGMTISVVGVQ
jgi:hypothetical protein